MKSSVVQPAVTIVLALLLGLVDTSSAQISVRSALSDDREVPAGTTYEGTILVRNDTDEEQEARVFQTDYLFYDDGSNAYDPPGSTERSNAEWIRVAPRQLIIPPAETMPVSYVVSVPNAPLGGTYWSMIMVEAIPHDAPESILRPDDRDKQFGVRQVLRYGVQVATHLPTTGDADLRISRTQFVEEPGGNTVLQLTLENHGSRMVRPTVWLDLYDPTGNARARKSGATNRIYPSTSVRQQFDLGSLDAGTYKALVFIDAGSDDVLGAEYALEIE